ncbi:hypothetical protein RM190_04970 [Paracoccus sp. CPCC 101403]|uniref:Minor tail protein n=1 Tax=Paracoccus broussonetiae TaxID=3075834 RepID=A0ABU3EAF1_9RHOB|nr:hypothetical protein [Paracoccus sp. CPCC 101403]MDT1061201.1 hypothetical protein [Paracoccus sp. CPCC 101403]
MATILQFDAVRAVDINSFAVPGALVTFYNSGTTAVRTVYADPDCTIPHPSPLEADGAGVFPPVYDVGGGDVKVAVTTPAGVMLAGYPMDPIAVVSTTAAGASGIAFNPTEEIPETNVQDAIERVQANLVEPLAEFGLGVTGNATLLGNLDATGTASGFYRFDGTTLGAFPAGVTAANGGIVMLYRRTSTSALMFLQQSNSSRVYVRRLATTWQPWSWLVSSADTVANSVWETGSSTTPAAATPAGVMAAVDAKAIGVGQTWQVPSPRVPGNTYRNTTGRPIMVSAQWGGGDENQFQISTNASTWLTISRSDSTTQVIIPHNHYYRLTAGTIIFWAELR